MKKYISVFLFMLIFIAYLTVHSHQQELPPELENPEGFVFYQYQYAYIDVSLIYPENWINHSSQERGILIYTPDSKGSLHILASPLFGKEYTLEELWSLNMDNLKLAGAVFLLSVQDVLSGYPAIRALHTIKIGRDTHKYIRYNAIAGDLFYSFSFNTPEVDFERYLNDVLVIARSISIKINE